MSKKDAEKRISDFLQLGPEDFSKSIKRHPEWRIKIYELLSQGDVQVAASKSLVDVQHAATGQQPQGSKSFGGKPDPIKMQMEHSAHHPQPSDIGTTMKSKEFLDKEGIDKNYPTEKWEDLLNTLQQCVKGKEDRIRYLEDKLKRMDSGNTQQLDQGTIQTQSSTPAEKQDKNDGNTAGLREKKQKTATDSRPQKRPASGPKESRTDGVGPDSQVPSQTSTSRALPASVPKENDRDAVDWRDILNMLKENLSVRDRSIGVYEEEVKEMLDRKDFEIDRANNCEQKLNIVFEEKIEVEKKNKVYEVDLEKLTAAKLHVEQQFFDLKEKHDHLLAEMKGKEEENTNLLDANYKMEKALRKLTAELESLKQHYDNETKNKNKQLEALKKEKDDYRDRFSKMAGDKLTEKNADIADLSDPNRAMKLADRFSGLYDDEWTDAFQALSESKMQPKDALKLLLRILKTCYDSCERIAGEQFERLTSCVVFPAKTVSRISKEMPGGIKSAPRLGSKNEKILRDARRQMWESSVDVVKQSLMEQTKEWIEKENGPKAFECTLAYVEKCAEICWLMVIHDPPVCMKTEAEPDEKMDPIVYTAYSSSGQKVDFIVWPPLYNGKGGGLLAKGVVETIRTVTKEKKK